MQNTIKHFPYVPSLIPTSNTMKRHYGHFTDGKTETEIQANGLVCLFPLSHAVSIF